MPWKYQDNALGTSVQISDVSLTKGATFAKLANFHEVKGVQWELDEDAMTEYTGKAQGGASGSCCLQVTLGQLVLSIALYYKRINYPPSYGIEWEEP